METKRERSRREDRDRDRISHLPDELLHNILSFLDTRYAVQMSVLSKRWVSLWKFLPFLQFSDDFPRDLLVQKNKALWSFNNFIVQVIDQRHPTNLARVCLRTTLEVDAFVIQYLISYAIQHNVQNLELYNSCYLLFSLYLVCTESFYDFQSLIAKFLTFGKYPCYHYRNNSIQLPKYLAFPALKSLDLYGIFLGEDNSDSSIFSSYPNLETLNLSHLDLSGPKPFRVHALNLKKLVISDLNEGPDFQDNKLEIHAPKLTTFKYIGPFNIVCSTERLTSLDDVFIDLFPSHYEIKEDDFPYVMNTFKEFNHAKSLTLSMGTIEVLSKFPALLDDYQQSFANLKCLKLKVPPYVDDLQLSFANLKCLKLKVPEHDKELQIPEHVLKCFTNSSTVLEICS